MIEALPEKKEYRCVTVSYFYQLEETLNKFGKDGWDLVFIQYNNTDAKYEVVLKRIVSEFKIVKS